MVDEFINPDAELRISALNHTTFPVRDRIKAARFYVAVLGGEVHHASAGDRVSKGLARSLQVGVRLCPGVELDLFEQDYGQPEWDQSHPHLALEIPAQDMDQWVRHLEKWHVPFVGPMTRQGSGSAQIYFNDPDGNHLELYARNYPGSEKLPSGPYDKMLCVHKAPWPSALLEAQAALLLDSSMARMAERRKKA